MVDFWIIRTVGYGREGTPLKRHDGRARPEYEVSDLGRALMLHLPHFIWAPLVGFEARLKKGRSIRPFLRRRASSSAEGHPAIRYHESDLFQDLDFSEYPELTDYVRKFRTALIKKSRVFAELSRLNLERVDDLLGLYPGTDGTLQVLSLSGTLEQKRQYIEDHCGQLIEIQVDPSGSYESNITFRLDARRLRTYLRKNVYEVQSLIRDDTQQEVHVFRGRKRLFRMVNSEVINRLFMIQHSMDLNAEFRKALEDTVTGELFPVKLSVKSFQVGQAFDQLSSATSLEREFEQLKLSAPDRHRVMRQLTGRVVLCLYSYQSGLVGKSQHIHSIGAILHNLAGMSGVEKDFPQLVDIVRSRSANSQIGAYYLFSEFASSVDLKAVKPGAQAAPSSQP